MKKLATKVADEILAGSAGIESRQYSRHKPPIPPAETELIQNRQDPLLVQGVNRSQRTGIRGQSHKYYLPRAYASSRYVSVSSRRTFSRPVRRMTP